MVAATTDLPPPNTIVVTPKPLPLNGGALWALFWAIGVFMGLFARELIGGPPSTAPTGTSSRGNAASGASAPLPTLAVLVRAVLELPSPTPTGTPAPTAADPAGRLNFCTGTDAPGTLCRQPMPPPPTPTPYPSCGSSLAVPGDWCMVPTIVALGGKP